MSKPRLARLAQEAAKITFLFNRTLPEGVTRAIVTSFLGILRDNPSKGDIKDYVGEPSADVVSDYEDLSEELELFANKEIETAEEKRQYFYQRLAVAHFDNIISQGVSASQELMNNMAADTGFLNEYGEYSDRGISPISMYLHAKFQDLKERFPAVSNLSYNEFKELTWETLEDDNKSTTSLEVEEDLEFNKRYVRILTGQGSQEDLALVIQAAPNRIPLDMQSVTSQDMSKEQETDARSVVSAGSVHSQLNEAQLAEAFIAAKVILENTHQAKVSSQSQRQELRSVGSVDSGRMISDIASVSSQSILDGNDSVSVNSYEEPGGHQTLRDKRSVSPAAPAVPTTRNRGSGEGSGFEELLDSSGNIEGILNKINARLDLISAQIANGEPVGAIAQSLDAMRSHLATIGRGLPPQGAFAQLRESVRKIGTDITKIIRTPPATVRGSDEAQGLLGDPGAADLTPIMAAIKKVAQDAKVNALILKAELLSAVAEAENLAQQRSRFLSERQGELLHINRALERNIGDLGVQVFDLTGKVDSMSGEFAGIRKDMAKKEDIDALGGRVSDLAENVDSKSKGGKRIINFAQLRAGGHDQDSEGNEFLVPQIKGREAVNESGDIIHTGIEQDYDGGIPVFVYDDLNDFSQDVEHAASKKWPDTDSEKVVTSIARIEDKYCAVTASSGGVTKTFLDQGQFEEMEKTAQVRYEAVVQAQHKAKAIEEVVKLLEAEKLEAEKEDEGSRRINELDHSVLITNKADNIAATIDYLNETILGSLLRALSTTNKDSALERDQAIEKFNNWDCEEDLWGGEHGEDKLLSARKKAKALDRGIKALESDSGRYPVGDREFLAAVINNLKAEVLQPVVDALNPNNNILQSDRDNTVTNFNNDWESKGYLDVVRMQMKKKALEKLIYGFQDSGGCGDLVGYLQTEVLGPLNNVLDPNNKYSSSDKDKAIKEFNNRDYNAELGTFPVDPISNKAVNDCVQGLRDNAPLLKHLYELLGGHIENPNRYSLGNIDGYQKATSSSVSRSDNEDEKSEKLSIAKNSATPDQKKKARGFASNQCSRDFADDVKKSIKENEINDLDSIEVSHLIKNMATEMYGGEAIHNKNRRADYKKKAEEILTAPMPHTSKKGISFERPRDSNTVTIAFNFDQEGGGKLSGDSLAYFHIPGTNEMYGRAQICKDPTRPMAVMVNGKEELKYYKLGDVVIDPDTIFHRNAAGKYDHFGTTGTFWNGMESTFGEKGKNAITLYKALGVKAISQINRAGKGEEPDVERKVAVLCEGKAFAYNGVSQEKEYGVNADRVMLYGGDKRASGKEEDTLGKKKNAVDENGDNIEFKMGSGEKKHKHAKVSKINLPNGTPVDVFVDISTDSVGRINHGNVPLIAGKSESIDGEEGINLVEKLLLKRMGIEDLDSESAEVKKSFHEKRDIALISLEVVQESSDKKDRKIKIDDQEYQVSYNEQKVLMVNGKPKIMNDELVARLLCEKHGVDDVQKVPNIDEIMKNYKAALLGIQNGEQVEIDGEEYQYHSDIKLPTIVTEYKPLEEQNISDLLKAETPRLLTADLVKEILCKQQGLDPKGLDPSLCTEEDAEVYLDQALEDYKTGGGEKIVIGDKKYAVGLHEGDHYIVDPARDINKLLNKFKDKAIPTEEELEAQIETQAETMLAQIQNDCKNTRLVVTSVDARGNKSPVITASDEFEGIGKKDKLPAASIFGKGEIKDAALGDDVSLGAAQESYSHVQRAKSPKGRGGRGGRF